MVPIASRLPPCDSDRVCAPSSTVSGQNAVSAPQNSAPGRPATRCPNRIAAATTASDSVAKTHCTTSTEWPKPAHASACSIAAITPGMSQDLIPSCHSQVITPRPVRSRCAGSSAWNTSSGRMKKGPTKTKNSLASRAAASNGAIEATSGRRAPVSADPRVAAARTDVRKDCMPTGLRAGGGQCLEHYPIARNRPIGCRCWLLSNQDARLPARSERRAPGQGRGTARITRPRGRARRRRGQHRLPALLSRSGSRSRRPPSASPRRTRDPAPDGRAGTPARKGCRCSEASRPGPRVRYPRRRGTG